MEPVDSRKMTDISCCLWYHSIFQSWKAYNKNHEFKSLSIIKILERWVVILTIVICFMYYNNLINIWKFHVPQFSSVTQSCPTLCDPMNLSTPGLPVHHQLPKFTQTHVHQVSDAIQPSHPLLSPSPPASNPSQHQGLFQWVNSSHEVAQVLEFQL